MIDSSTSSKSITTSDNSIIQTKWDRWGTKSYTVMPHVSPQSKKIAEEYRLRPTDVIVLSFPKTGTTWTQTVCEQIRTNAEGYDGFDDITERQPWLEFAYDCGQDLNDDQYGSSPTEPMDGSDSLSVKKGILLKPRIFKSHQLLSAVNTGGKYLCIVRDPAATLLSWFDFQKAKGRPGYAEYSDANEYIASRPELFAGNQIFGTNIWQMYEELWSARNDPSVKILVYEGLIADAPNGYTDHLPIIANFLECSIPRDERATAALYQRVAHLVSREMMVRYVDKFDDHFIAEKGKQYGRALRIMEPAAKVRKLGGRTELSEATLEWLEDRWLETMTPKTGHASYDDFATELSELLFAAEEDSVDNASSHQHRIDQAKEKQSRTSSTKTRRNSSLVIQQMPGIRKRRESLAPHE